MISKIETNNTLPVSVTVKDIGVGNDAIHIEKGLHAVQSEWIDLFSHSIEKIDECFSVVRGGSAIVKNCIFEGAEKVSLIGCGDSEWYATEQGKWVIFENCIFRKGSRRMPEVQSGMVVLLINCIIEDWCLPERQPTNPKKARGFGAWAHDGGIIIAINCTFNQNLPFWRGGWKFMISDLLGHLGNAWNESGIFGILNPLSWIPGVCRGLTASDGGFVKAVNCKKNHWWIRIEGK